MATPLTCNIEPFTSKVVPRADDPSAVQLFIQQLENYLRRLKTAICTDLQGAAGGAGSFLGLSDTPDSYAGQALKGVRVKSTVDGLEFFTLLSAFLQLSDTPNSYAGQGGNIVTVNGAETALQFSTPSSVIDVASVALTPSLHLMWLPNVATPFLGAVGVSPVAIEVGTGSFQLPTGGNTLSARPRARYTSAGLATSNAAFRNSGNLTVHIGAGANEGGFRFQAKFGTESNNGTQRLFVGLSATITFGNVTLASRVNLIGFGYDTAGTQLSIVHNDAAGAAVVTPLGAAFPVDAVSLYDVQLVCLPNAASIDYTVTRINDGATTSGSISTDLPANTVTMTPYCWIHTGGTASAVSLAMAFLRIENYN